MDLSKTWILTVLALIFASLVFANNLVVEEGVGIDMNDRPIINLEPQSVGEPASDFLATIGYIDDSIDQLGSDAEEGPDTFEVPIGNEASLGSTDEEEREFLTLPVDEAGDTVLPLARPFNEDVDNGKMWIEAGELHWHYQGEDWRTRDSRTITSDFEADEIPPRGSIWLVDDDLKWVTLDREVKARNGGPSPSTTDTLLAEYGDFWISDGDRSGEEAPLLTFVDMYDSGDQWDIYQIEPGTPIQN